MATRYFTPGKQQMISAYTPIPIDFYMKELEKRQNAYNETQQYLTASKGTYGGMDVTGADVARKNALVEEYFGNIRKDVAEQGGDYGKLQNEVMDKVMTFAQDPRLQAMKQNLAEQKQFRENQMRLSSQGKLVQNPNWTPDMEAIQYDPNTGKTVVPDRTQAFTEKPDYDSLLDKTIAKFNNTVYEGKLTGENAGMGLLQRLTSYGASPATIRTFVDEHPALVNSFIDDAGNAFKWDPRFASEKGYGDPQKAKDFVVNTLINDVRNGSSVQDIPVPGWAAMQKDQGQTGYVQGPSTAGGRIPLTADNYISKKVPALFGVHKPGEVSVNPVTGQSMVSQTKQEDYDKAVLTQKEQVKKVEEEFTPWKSQYGDLWKNKFDEASRAFTTQSGTVAYPKGTKEFNEFKAEFNNNDKKYCKYTDITTGETFDNYDLFLQHLNGGNKFSGIKGDTKRTSLENNIDVTGIDASELFSYHAYTGVANGANGTVYFQAEKSNDGKPIDYVADKDILKPNNFVKLESEWHNVGPMEVKAKYQYLDDQKKMVIQEYRVRNKNGDERPDAFVNTIDPKTGVVTTAKENLRKYLRDHNINPTVNE